LRTKILAIVFVVTTCCACKQLAYRKHIKTYSISYGQGGGFTGATTEHILKGDGNLYFIREFSTDTAFVHKIENKKLKQVFRMAESKTLLAIEQDKPGNMSSFIRLYKDKQLVKSWVWAEGAEVAQPLKDLQIQLRTLK
jgi:hypothetical protein